MLRAINYIYNTLLCYTHGGTYMYVPTCIQAPYDREQNDGQMNLSTKRYGIGISLSGTEVCS